MTLVEKRPPLVTVAKEQIERPLLDVTIFVLIYIYIYKR